MGLNAISSALLKGIYHSFKGMSVICYLDKEINERKQNRHSPTIRQKHIEREPSPHPHQRKQEDSKVIHKVLQCATLNGGIFLASVFVFECLLLPSLNKFFSVLFGSDAFVTMVVWSWIEYIVLLVYRSFWLVPLFFLSRVINAFWFQDIADSAYRYSRGRPVAFPSISELFADSIFSIFVQFLFLLQASLTSYIPIYPVGYILYVVQMSLLYSLYSFEYKWFNMGWKLHERLAFIENHWPYFVGFGLPLTIFTQLSDSWVVSGCVFSILFPFFILSGNEASPVTDASDIHLQLFTPVIAVANTFFSKIIGNNKHIPSAATNANTMPQQTSRLNRR
ncbi:etoposide-induced protein 2.4 homolog [Sitophilus oryzae]|uniref:Etoposide-induced protein 2.4 homolog n=1 Tax=Sitophilus oryzae TaxID=7048 RepID=A0A6J2YT07_SITOR|nr:etoposide-induced protein 2.4 homolog [Sitophilus oryzae]